MRTPGRALALLLLAAGSCVAGSCVAAPGGERSGPATTTASGGQPAAGPATTVVTDPAAGRAATVRIVVDDCTGGRMGSGFVLDATTVLTNRHVVEGARRITVETWNGETLTVDHASQSAYADLGIVAIARTAIAPLALADGDAPRGTTVQVLGFPLDGPFTSTGGVVAEYVVEPSISSVDPVLRLNVDLNPGNSGGPVLDRTGHVAGVAFASELATGYGLAVPASTVRAALRDTRGIDPVRACS